MQVDNTCVATSIVHLEGRLIWVLRNLYHPENKADKGIAQQKYPIMVQFVPADFYVDILGMLLVARFTFLGLSIWKDLLLDP